VENPNGEYLDVLRSPSSLGIGGGGKEELSHFISDLYLEGICTHHRIQPPPEIIRQWV
jgi:hypothetical protein